MIKIYSIIFAVLLSSAQAFAHGGGLDSRGGHNDRKHGGYHFHRGPLAGNSYASKTEATQAYQTASHSESPTPSSASPAPAPVSPGGSITGRASVIDGDTIEIHGQRIRLHGIDAPESSQTCTMSSGEPWRCGADAANKLAEKIGDKTISCAERDKDRYGRIVAVCSIDNQNINAWLVSEGLAVAYQKYSSDYVPQEVEAKKADRGIWASKFDMPWDWRKARK